MIERAEESGDRPAVAGDLHAAGFQQRRQFRLAEQQEIEQGSVHLHGGARVGSESAARERHGSGDIERHGFVAVGKDELDFGRLVFEPPRVEAHRQGIEQVRCRYRAQEFETADQYLVIAWNTFAQLEGRGQVVVAPGTGFRLEPELLIGRGEPAAGRRVVTIGEHQMIEDPVAAQR